MNLHKKFFSKIGFNYLIFGVSALIIQIILLNILNVLNIDLIYDFNFNVILSSICNYVLPFPIFYFLMNKLEKTRLKSSKIGVKTIILYMGITFTLMWIGNIIGLILSALIGVAIQNDISNPVQNLINNSDIWLNLLLISFIGPIFEEIIFRKMLIDRSIKYGARISIILSALLFAFFHANINQFFYALLMGGFFAYIYIKTGKIIYTISLHIFINLMGSVVSLFVAESAQNLMNNAATPLDWSIILIYIIFLLLMWIIGIIGLSQYKNAEFNGSKTKIALKHPLKTMILNYGIICFIGYFICLMIYQLIG